MPTSPPSEADKSGKLIIEAKGIGRTYGDRTIVDDFSIRVQRGDRIGIVGPNGAGKTTLIEMLTGGSPPDSGTIRFGANIEMATLDQHRESLDPKSTLADALTGGGSDNVMVGGKPKHVVSYMKDFLFAQEQMRTPLEVLSGGERGRLMLARALAKAVQPAGAGRADQRSRSRNPRRARGNARRLRRHRDPDQP